MIQQSGSFEATWILKILLLISVTLISACENDEITKPQIQTEPAEAPLPVREWYPGLKHRQQPGTYAPAAAMQPQAVIAPPAYQGNAVQQPWAVPTQVPVYSAPQPMYQTQMSGPQYQQPQVWTGQQYVTPSQQPVAPHYQPQYQYQYAPRPWGSMTEPINNQGSAASTQAWPQGGYGTPWGTPVPGSSYYGTTGVPAGQAPGTIYYDQVW